jgi:hypothetical protein
MARRRDAKGERKLQGESSLTSITRARAETVVTRFSHLIIFAGSMMCPVSPRDSALSVTSWLDGEFDFRCRTVKFAHRP